MNSEPRVALHRPVADEVRKPTCYMCACRCGIDVHIKDGKIRYIEGNRDHPVNKGVLCAKGSAGIMQHYAPARLRAPLKRVGPRGSGQFQEISWEEALETAAGWLGEVRRTDPKKLAFFTGRDQSQSLTGYWAQQFGTPNYAAHGGFCSVNMAAAGIMTLGGAFWEFGAPDWERTKLFVMFGVAEDHDSNPIKMGIAKLKQRGARFVSVNPGRTGYSAVADNWIGIRPGTDGLLILSIIHELLKARRIDVDYLVRYSNAPWLVIDAPGREEHGLFARDGEGRKLVFETVTERVVPVGTRGARPALSGRFELPDGRFAVPSFQLLAEKYLDPKYAPEAVSAETGISADVIRGLAAEIARVAFDEAITIEQPWTDMNGERHQAFVGRPVSFHAMRGLSAHSNGFQTTRALHLLQVMIGAVDCPGAFRFEPPYPKPAEGHPRPHGRKEHIAPDRPLAGPHLGFPQGPEDLLVEEDGSPSRIDKAFSWDAPISAHGLMHMVIANAHARDPYAIDVLFLYMANMAWNSSMNTAGTMKMLEEKDPETGDYIIPKII
jgi:anaerobic selenocysteine-containing dehydrogenase